MIFTGFSPNLTTRDTLTSLSYLVLPWKWLSIRKGGYNERAKVAFESLFEEHSATLFDSGRSALYYGLLALGVKKGDDVLVQAYTCVVVINAIRWIDATPVYVDVDENYNIDLEDLKKKITPQTKTIIIQHTFGVPAKAVEIVTIAKAHSITTIEDCAHSIGATTKGKQIGTIADIGMFSFGSDKAISSVRGGALITNNAQLYKNIIALHSDLKKMSLLAVLRHLLHLPFFFVGKPLYGITIGKILLYVGKKLHITNKIIRNEEKRGERTPMFPSLMPNSLAHILLRQIGDLKSVNKHRNTIAQKYDVEIKNRLISKPTFVGEGVYLRYAIEVENPSKFRSRAKQAGIIVGDWYDTVVAPKDIDMKATLYKKGMCTKAEKHSSRTVNLPTNRCISKKDAERIITFCNSYGS